MTPSAECLALIMEFEGLRLDAYRCAAGVMTIGYGHTGNVSVGDVITQHQAEVMLQNDVAVASHSVNALVTVPMTQGIFDALVSFVFNLGASKLAGSTLLRLLNAGDYQGASDQLLRWVYAAGKRLSGLERRREAEQALWLKGRRPDFSNVIAGSATTAPAN